MIEADVEVVDGPYVFAGARVVRLPDLKPAADATIERRQGQRHQSRFVARRRCDHGHR